MRVALAHTNKVLYVIGIYMISLRINHCLISYWINIIVFLRGW